MKKRGKNTRGKGKTRSNVIPLHGKRAAAPKPVPPSVARNTQAREHIVWLDQYAVPARVRLFATYVEFTLFGTGPFRLPVRPDEREKKFSKVIKAVTLLGKASRVRTPALP